MTTKENLSFKMSMLGPSRVGKTSIIASMIANAKDLLNGTQVSLLPSDPATRNRVRQFDMDLQGDLLAGEFNPGGLAGGENDFRYQLTLDPGHKSAAGIDLTILDYPGAWLTSEPPEWGACLNFIKQSTILVVPVEAAVLMEAVASTHMKAVPGILGIWDISQNIELWAKERNKEEHRSEPALLVLCPVKCESYFDDNGGRNDQSDKLFAKVRKVYSDVIDLVRLNAPRATIGYMPIDTIGCVEIVTGNWSGNGVEFTADYRVRPPGRRSIKGADALLVSVCKQIFNVTAQAEARVATMLTQEAKDVMNHADRDDGLWGNFVLWWRDTREKERNAAGGLGAEAQKKRAAAKSLRQTLERLGTRGTGLRERQL